MASGMKENNRVMILVRGRCPALDRNIKGILRMSL